MKKKWQEYRYSLFRFEHTEKEWKAIKISLVVLTLIMDTYILYNRHSQPFPVGICQLFDCSSFAQFPIYILFMGLVVLFSVWYIREKNMLISTFGLFATGVILYSLEESNANPAENALMTLVYLAHFIAYAKKRFVPITNIANDRLQYTTQFVAAVYTLAGISKLWTSGMSWFADDSQKFSLEVMRIYMGNYVSTGNNNFLAVGQYISDFITKHSFINSTMLFIALALELCSFILVLNKKMAYYYSILLLIMHAGFFLAMNIFFPSIIFPLLILFINPLYHTIGWFGRFKRNSPYA